MGIFDIFKKKPKFVDSIFGELYYTKFSDITKNFYDGDVKFMSEKIGITIDADEDGPTEKNSTLNWRVNILQSKLR